MREVQGPETSGQLPAGGQSDEHHGRVAAGALVLAVLCLPAAVMAAATWLCLLAQVRRDWREVAAVAAGLAAVAALLVQLWTGQVLPDTLGWIPAMLTGHLIGGLAAAAAVGMPLGVAVGAWYTGLTERRVAGAEWHPVEQRKRAAGQAKTDRRARDLMHPDAQAASPVMALGIYRGGDLDTWVHDGEYVAPPPGKFPAIGLVGESGSGKTVTAGRLVEILAARGRKVFFADFKGSDPDLAAEIVAAFRTVRTGDVRTMLWPAQSMDIWRGDPAEIANRLLQVQEFSEPFYQAVSETLVRLACNAPGPRVASSEDFMARLDGDRLKRVYEGTPQLADVLAVTTDPALLAGVRLRYSGFFAALAGRLDGGQAFEDVDMGMFTIPTLVQPSDAMAAARMVLADFGAYCLRRKPRDEQVTFIVDEFSAVSAAARMVIELAERIRDAGGQVVVCAQDFEGLGRGQDERLRMRDALVPGGLIIHRMAEPSKLVTAAGTVRGLDQAWDLDDTGHTGSGRVSVTSRAKVDPDEVRQLKTGEAFVITGGRQLRMSVLPTSIPDDVREQARQEVNAAHAAAAALGHDDGPQDTPPADTIPIPTGNGNGHGNATIGDLHPWN
jgi:ABC-type oligopeptide transport system ATPase subunit